MQVEVAESGPCSRTLKIQVPANAISDHIDAMFASANQQVRMKGFRPGKVPRKILERHLGPQILKEAKEQIVSRYFNEACQQQSIAPVGRIVVDDFDKIEVQTGAGLQFTVKLDVRPDFKLQETKGLEVSSFPTDATDADVDHALSEIANQKRAMTAVDEPAQKGDFVTVDLRFIDEGGTQVHERKGVKLNTGIPIAGTDAAAFEKALIGAEKGHPIELALQFPDNFEKDAVRGKPGKAILDVHQVVRVTAPPVDDALAKGLDFENLLALRADLRSRIAQEKVRVGKLRQEDEALQQLLEKHQFELPASLVDEQQQASLTTFARRLEENGASKEEIEKRLEESKDEAHKDALRRVRLFFLIESIARQQKLFVTEGDVDGELRNIAQQNQVTPDRVREHLEQNRQMGDLRLAILERKVRDFLRENARVVDRTDG